MRKNLKTMGEIDSWIDGLVQGLELGVNLDPSNYTAEIHEKKLGQLRRIKVRHDEMVTEMAGTAFGVEAKLT